MMMRAMNAAVFVSGFAIALGIVGYAHAQHASGAGEPQFSQPQEHQRARARAAAAIDVVHEALVDALPAPVLEQLITDLRERLMPPPSLNTRAAAKAIAASDHPQHVEHDEDADVIDRPVQPISQSKHLHLGAVPQVRLPVIDTAPLKEQDRLVALSGLKTRRIGVGRGLTLTAADGNFTRVNDAGWLWSVEVASPQALGLRLHFADVALPPGGVILVYSPDHPHSTAGPYHNTGPFPSGEFWAPTLFGERARIEYFVPTPAGRSLPQPPRPHSLPFTIDAIQHLYVDPLKSGDDPDDNAGNCHNDVKCYPYWAQTAKAVGRIAYIEAGSSYLCSGQLINALNGDFTPYFLTAKHCIDTNGVAQTAEIFWKYQTSTCGGAPPSEFSVPTSNVCTLLKTGSSSDYTLLMVEGKLPQGLTWAGWTAEAANDGDDVACIHHPGGSYKRISFGDKVSNPLCGTQSGFLRVDWTSGPTEPGSSGSGAFRADTRQLIGILSCGSSACGNITNDSYGALAAFYAGIAFYLDGGSDDWLEENDWCSAAKSITPGTYNNLIVKGVDADWYRVYVAAGKRLTVTVSFTNSYGNINLKLHRLCNTEPLVTARGGGNTETVTYINPEGGTWYRFRVNVANDPRNSYNMVVSITDP